MHCKLPHALQSATVSAKHLGSTPHKASRRFGSAAMVLAICGLAASFGHAAQKTAGETSVKPVPRAVQDASPKPSKPDSGVSSIAKEASPAKTTPEKPSPRMTEAKTSTRPQTKVRLPRYYGKLNLTADQRAEVLNVAGKYQALIDELQERVLKLKMEREIQLKSKLQPEQEKMLGEMTAPRKLASAPN